MYGSKEEPAAPLLTDRCCLLSSSRQRRRPLHVCGCEVHGQHHERLLCSSSHCSFYRGVGHPLWPPVK